MALRFIGAGVKQPSVPGLQLASETLPQSLHGARSHADPSLGEAWFDPSVAFQALPRGAQLQVNTGHLWHSASPAGVVHRALAARNTDIQAAEQVYK